MKMIRDTSSCIKDIQVKIISNIFFTLMMSVIVADGKAYIKFQHTDVCSVIRFMKLLFPKINIRYLVNRGNFKSSVMIDEYTMKVYNKKIIIEINNIDDKNPVIRKSVYSYIKRMLLKYKTIKPFPFEKKVMHVYEIENECIKSETPIHKYKKYFSHYLIL